VATTADDPERARLDDRLRPDLYYALTTLVIRLAPLRDRLDELPLLAQHLLERANRRGERRRSEFSPEAMDALIGYDWPGNLRELARVIDAAHARVPPTSSGSTTCRRPSAATWARPTPRRRCPRRSCPWTSS
jgi:DNA-binding NtrC family response regulator